MMIGEVSEGFDIILSPIAFAGWAGLFVTALNLLPIGQLDGGHIIYALLGKYSGIVYKAGIGAFCIFTLFVYPGWIIFAVMLLLFGFKHPPPADPFIQLDFKRKCIGVLMLIVFLLCFTPIPIKF
jgi:membrane-associated protease RseP (regulator of RpoE activity)